MTLFANGALARRIEGAETRLELACGAAVQRRRPDALVVRLGGGAAVFSGEESPFDKVIGLGFEPFDEDTFARFEETVLGHGGAVRVEVSTRADPVVVQTLSRRGYVLTGFEDVLGLRIEDATLGAGGAEVDVQPVSAGEHDVWIDLVVTGFAHPDRGDGPSSDESFPREALERVFRDLENVEGFRRYLARREGEIAGGGSLRIDGGIAQLAGAATLPAHRRRGVQTALTRARLADAARAGCDIATVTTLPGSKSQDNSMRQGFSLLYARAVLIKRRRGTD